ncbi:hypothetical protein ABEB36_006346 [Hypothenemus hampei]|uniref:Uncharacterized protein n=1 Tax=Hypothenemus hampei TaxID=57062 RepID=A0ABD1EQ80_HYPHA
MASLDSCNSNFNVSNGWCPPVFDHALCWPATPPGTVVNQSCPDEEDFNPNGLAYKECLGNGSWYINEKNIPWSNYTECIDLESLDFYNFINRLYVIGYSISLVAIAVSLAIFLCFPTLRCARIRIHIQLFLTFIGNNACWILWYRWVVANDVTPPRNPLWCQILHIIKEYFMVANYLWMFCEALHIHLALVVVFVREERTRRWLHVIGWGVSLLITLNHTLIRLFYVKDTAFCWLNEKSFSSWFISVPIGITLILSTIFLINVLRVILLVSPRPQSPRPDHTSIKRALRAALILTPLFGLQFMLIPIQPDSSHSLYHLHLFLSSIIIPYQVQNLNIVLNP